MGIVKKQSIQSTIFTYLGVGIGFLNSAILLPALFTTEEVGLIGFLNSLTLIFSTIGCLGIPLITIKLFPQFRNREKGDNGFFSLSFYGSLIGISIGIIAFLSLNDILISKDNAARNYSLFFIAFTTIFAFRVLFKNIDSYLRMLYKTVLGIMLEGFITKLIIFIGLLIITWGFKGDFSLVLILYIIAISLPGVIATIYLLTQKVSLNVNSFRKSAGYNWKEIVSIGSFGVIGGLGAAVILEVDRVMISNMLGLSENGIYSVAFFFGLFISIPSRGLKRIAASILSDSFKDNDMTNVAEIYKKSCLNQLLIAGYLFLGIWFTVNHVFEFMRPEYSRGLYVILFIGLAQLIDMATGVNAEIINVSKYYKYNSYFTGILIVLVIGLNLIFIPIWGINGAAFSSFLALLIVNTIRFIFLYRKMGLFPFSIKMLINAFIILGLFGCFEFFMPNINDPLLGILISGGLLTIIYFTLAYFLRLSNDVNQIINKVFRIKQ